jgi:hypothetical protein
MKSNDEKGKKSYYSLVLWMKSTTPRNPMIMDAGRNIEGNSGILLITDPSLMNTLESP